MKDIVVEQSKILKLSCYKAAKYQGKPEAACPFGFEEINKACQNCQWLSISTAQMLGARRLVVDEKIAELPVGSQKVITDGDILAKINPKFFERKESLALPPGGAVDKEG